VRVGNSRQQAQPEEQAFSDAWRIKRCGAARSLSGTSRLALGRKANSVPPGEKRGLPSKPPSWLFKVATEHARSGVCSGAATPLAHCQWSAQTAGFVRAATMDRAGVDLPHLPHLFARFYRVDAGRTSDSGDGVAVGHGLGLAITRWVARAHSGIFRCATALRAALRLNSWYLAANVAKGAWWLRAKRCDSAATVTNLSRRPARWSRTLGCSDQRAGACSNRRRRRRSAGPPRRRLHLWHPPHHGCLRAPFVILSTSFLSSRIPRPTALADSGLYCSNTVRFAASSPVENISSM
jgi:hypothetical protein